MLTALLLSGVMQFTSPTVFREPPPVPKSTKREFQIGGGYVLECDYSWSDWQPDGGSGKDHCNHEGVRKKHVSHLACTDGTCHQECQREHNPYGTDYDAQIEMYSDFAPSMRRWARDLNDGNTFLRNLFYEDVSLSAVVNDFRENVLGELRKVREYSPYLGEHFANSCESVDRWMDYVRSECTMTYRLRSSSLGFLYHEQSFPVASLKTVGRGYLRRYLSCKCDPALIPPKPVKETALMPPGTPTDANSEGYAGIWVDQDGDGLYDQIGLGDAAKYEIVFRSGSMTTFEVTCKGGSKAPAGIVIVPGFVLDSSNSKVQDLLVCGGVKLAPRSGGTSGKGRAACLEMNKSTPTMATRFKPVSAPQPELITMAQFQATTQIAGPWDQARTWLFTNGASYDEIGKVLQPMIPPGRFLKEIENLRRMAISSRHPKVTAAFDPGFAAKPALTEQERGKYAQIAWNADPGRCLEWIDKQSELNSPGVPAMVAEGMFASPLKMSQALATKLRSMKKGAFTQQGGWDLLGSALMGSDAKAAETALAAMEEAPDRAQLWYLLNVRSSLPGSIRTRAEKLASALLPRS